MKRKIDVIFETSILLNEIKRLLSEKNIIVSEEVDNKKRNMIIELKDKQNNVIGEINGGVGEFKIIENGEDSEKDAFSINWLKVEDKYKGYNLGSFLIIYCIYLVKINFTNINYIVLDDDSDEINMEKNIYYKLGFIYQETKQVRGENGQMITVSNGSEMQLNITDFFDKDLLDKLYKINSKMRTLIKYEGGKRKTRKQRRYIKNK